MDFLSVFPHAHGLIILDAFARFDFLEKPRHLVGAVGRQQDRDRAAHDLAVGVPVHSLGPCVPTANSPIQCLPDDHIIRRFHNRCQLLQSLVLFLELQIQAAVSFTDSPETSGYGKGCQGQDGRPGTEL